MEVEHLNVSKEESHIKSDNHLMVGMILMNSIWTAELFIKDAVNFQRKWFQRSSLSSRRVTKTYLSWPSCVH